MASFISTSSISLAPMIPYTSQFKSRAFQSNSIEGPVFSGLRLVPKIQTTEAGKKLSPIPGCSKTAISCSANAKQETLEIVQDIIAKQLSVKQTTVSPQTKFADMGADSLDTVEIMMALEEKFDLSIGEGGAENIATVQDAADLIEKVKATTT